MLHWVMPMTREFQLAKLELIDDGIAMEQRHVVDMKQHLAKADAMGWWEGTARAGELVELSQQRIARLSDERAALVAEMNELPTRPAL